MPPDRHTLVPPSLVAAPVGVAVGAELLAWALAAWPGTLSPAWYAAPRLLAAVHLITLGALALSILGYGWQLVLVVTAEAAPRWWPTTARAVNAVVVTGVLTLCAGMLAQPPGWLAAVGATLVMAGLVARSLTMLAVLGRARGRVVVRMWLLAAELSLLGGLTVGGLLLAGRMGHPLLANPVGGIGWHASLLLLGWVGGWIGGLAAVLLPMFAVSPVPSPRWMAAAGLCWFGGLALQLPVVWAGGAVLLVLTVMAALRRRVQRCPSVGVAVTIAGLLALALLAISLAVPGTVAGVPWVAGALVLFALPVLRGVSLRIGPFLVWSHALGEHLGQAPPVSSLVPSHVAAMAGAASVLGGLLVVAGLGSETWALAQAGAVAAFFGTATHASVALTAGWRAFLARNRLRALPGTLSSPSLEAP